MNEVIITIDGPAGCGKSTVAKLVAEKFGYFYLDSGATFRTVALAMKQSSIGAEDNDALKGFLKGLNIKIRKNEKNGVRYILNSTDVTDRIRDPDITVFSSHIAKLKNVREYLLGFQRQVGMQGNLVAEGRDMGTLVFSEAKYKFFLDAAPEERAKRRFEELAGRGADKEISYNKVLEGIQNRDRVDRERKESPLRPSENAVIIDTTDLTINEVLNRVMEILEGTGS